MRTRARAATTHGTTGATPAAWTPAALVEHLQDAVELELFTIPAYMTAYYSIRAAASPAAATAAKAIRTVMNEEMLHLQLACDVLGALGGRARFTDEAAPSYPHQLPFHRQPLEVTLGPATDEQLASFLAIELPTWEDPADAPHLPPLDAYDTIGEFYHSVLYGLRQVYGPKGAPWPTGAGAQVSGNFDDDAFVVKDLASATKAIKLIIVQGEGASKSNPKDDRPDEKAHYFQLQSIVGTLGAGDVIPSVRNVAGLTWSARCGALLDFFDAAYSAMLRQLEGNFRGEGEASATIFGSMTALGVLAAYVMQIDYAAGEGATAPPAGKLTPRFRYVKTAPQAAYDAIKESADAQSPSVKGMLAALPSPSAAG